MQSKSELNFKPINLSGLRSMKQKQAFDISMPKHLEVILKVSERCNINCKYCYFFDDRNLDFNARPAIISNETIQHLVRYLVDAIKMHDIETLQIDFHGGEPLLMKKHRFEEMCNQITKDINSIVDLRLSLQTNGILIDDEWIDIFEKYDIYVGVSLDGTAEINDLNRVDHKGMGTYHRVVKGIKKLQERRGSFFSIISVLTSASNGKDNFDHLVHDLNIKNMHFLAPDLTHNCKEKQPLGQSLIDIYDAWLVHNDTTTNIRFIKRAVSRILGSEQRLKADALNARDFFAFTVESDGHVGPDDDLRNIFPHLFRDRFNVFDSNLADFHLSPEISAMKIQIDAAPFKCSTCCWKNICGFGNILGGPVQRFSSTNSFENQSVYCNDIQDFLVRVCESAVKKWCALERVLENIS